MRDAPDSCAPTCFWHVVCWAHIPGEAAPIPCHSMDSLDHLGTSCPRPLWLLPLQECCNCALSDVIEEGLHYLDQGGRKLNIELVSLSLSLSTGLVVAMCASYMRHVRFLPACLLPCLPALMCVVCMWHAHAGLGTWYAWAHGTLPCIIPANGVHTLPCAAGPGLAHRHRSR